MHKLDAALLSIDSSVALDFHLTKSIDVLVELFEGKMLCSDFVKNQLPPTITFTPLRIVGLQEPTEWELFNTLKKDRKALGLGEIGAIVIAKSHGAVLLTNDKPTQRAAEESSIQVIGSIGVLDYAVERGKLRGLAAADLLHDMITQGARISTEALHAVHRRWSMESALEIKRPAEPRTPERILARTDDMS